MKLEVPVQCPKCEKTHEVKLDGLRPGNTFSFANLKLTHLQHKC